MSESFQWISGLISFSIDWLDPLAVQETLKSLLQHHGSKASILWLSTLTFIHDYWKNHSFDWMDLWQLVNVCFFNMLSRFVIPFLPRSKCLSISWLQSPSAVILEGKKIKSLTVSIFIIGRSKLVEDCLKQFVLTFLLNSMLKKKYMLSNTRMVVLLANMNSKLIIFFICLRVFLYSDFILSQKHSAYKVRNYTFILEYFKHS